MKGASQKSEASINNSIPVKSSGESVVKINTNL